MARHPGRPPAIAFLDLFPEPAQGVRYGLELVESLPRIGLPLARVGLHSGPVVFQEGDCFGGTVNVAARITRRRPAGGVLVSDQVLADADRLEGVRGESYPLVSAVVLS